MTEETNAGQKKLFDLAEITKSSFIIAIVISLFLGVGFGYLLFNKPVTGQVVLPSEAELKAKVEKYINENMLDNGFTIKVNSLSPMGDSLFEVSLTIYDENKNKVQDTGILVSADGAYLVGGIQDMSKPIPRQEEQEEPVAEVQKSEKPKLELYVMSFCPYGLQAEKATIPALQALGDKVEFQLRFIASCTDTTNASCSLHGANELKEDLRQLCIQRYQKDKLLAYLLEVANSCTLNTIESCWKTAAEKVSVDIAKVEACYNSEAATLMEAEIEASDAAGVTGSPTFIINGVKTSVTRTPDGVKTALCSAMLSEAEECNQKLSDTSATTSGSC